LGEAISLYIDDLERQYQDLSVINLNTFENYERKLGYNSTFTFLGEKPNSNYFYKTFLLEMDDYKSIYGKYYEQIDSLKAKYIALKEFYDLRDKQYNDYLRILKYDDARSKAVAQLTNIQLDSLLLNGIYTSPYYSNEMLYNDELLLKYNKLAKDINDPILRAEFYRNVTETFYLAINYNIDKFKDKQDIYRQQIKEYENKLGESFRKVRKRMPRYKEQYEPIRVTHSTAKMKLHEMQARIMEKQYQKINKRLDKYYNKYTDYIAFLDSSIMDQDNQFQKRQNQIIDALLAQEKKSKKTIIESRYYKDDIDFLRNIPIVDKRDFKRNYLEVGWDRYSNVSEMIWYDNHEEIKRKEYVYNRSNDLIQTVETQNNNSKTLTIYKLESRGEAFLDYSFDIELNFADENAKDKLNDADILNNFNDNSYIEIIWNNDFNASEIAWFDKDSIEIKRNFYNKDNSLARTIQDGDEKLNTNVDIDLSLSQIRFGKEEYLENYKDEIYINRKSVFDKMYSKSLSGQVAGILDINSDANGRIVNAVWYIGDRQEIIKEIIFPIDISLD